MTAKTPEQIVEAFWLGKPAVAEIRAYGEQCRREALAEQRDAKTPPEIPKFGQVARLVAGGGNYGAWDLLPAGTQLECLGCAMKIINALKVDGRHNIVIGDGLPDAFVAPGWVINRWLDSILSEGKP